MNFHKRLNVLIEFYLVHKADILMARAAIERIEDFGEKTIPLEEIQKKISLGKLTMLHNDVPDSTCLYCNKELNQATNPFRRVSPKYGDVSICIGCGQVLVFDERLHIRKPTAEEKKEFNNDQRIKNIQSIIKELPDTLRK